MKGKEEKQTPQEKDRHLDVPSEANRDKHINFLETEEDNKDRNRKDADISERQKQWKEGIEEGKRRSNQ